MPRSARDARAPARARASTGSTRPIPSCTTTPSSPPTSSAGGTEVDDLFATHDALAVAELIKTRKLGAQRSCSTARWRSCARLNAVAERDHRFLRRRAARDRSRRRARGRSRRALSSSSSSWPIAPARRRRWARSFFAKEPVAAADSAAVARMRRAGLVIVGRTNTSEFGLAPTTEPAFGGATRQSLAQGPLAGRLVGRLGGDRRGARPADGACHRRRRLDPHSGRLVRPVRPEAVARPDQPGADRRDAGRRRRAALRVDLGARQRRVARRRCRRRARRSLSRAAAAGTFLDATQRAPGRLRVAFMRKPVGGERARSRAGRRRSSARPGCSEELGHHVEEACARLRRRGTGDAPSGTVMCANTWTNIQLRAAGRVPGPDDLEPVTRLYCRTWPRR